MSKMESRLEEQSVFSPPEAFIRQANVQDPDMFERFEENGPEAWTEAAELLDWDRTWDRVLNDEDAPFYRWFEGGKLNVCYNCVDRHLEAGRKNVAAIQWEGEPGETRTITYRELHRRVNAFSAALREMGVQEDDLVTIYLPMIPQLPVSMLSCARIGAPHSVVFAGFSAEALAKRMENADSHHLITCDGYYRRGTVLNHGKKTEKGLNRADVDVDSVVVVDRMGPDLDHDFSRETYDYGTLMQDYEGARVEPVSRDAEDMLFLMYTSGTTGVPKGIKHTTGGYLAYTAWTARAVLDVKPSDTYWCAADVGWITGHSYIVYGPLALGTTTLMYEGAPDHPRKNRLWRMIETYGVDIFYTAPTAIRTFMKWGKSYPDAHDLSSLRLLGTVGEPINPKAWKWYYRHIGNENCPVVDTWWQTETGGMMITTLPGIHDMKPGSAGPSLPGIEARVVDGEGKDVEPGDAGYLSIENPWPGMLRTIYGDDDRFVSEYWSRYSDPDRDEWVYCPEDGARVDEDGYITVLGRVDDVINVSGHRLGTMEIESAIVDVDGVAEAAVVGGEHEIKGEAVHAYVIIQEDRNRTELRERIVESVEDSIGPIARPERVVFTAELPKTRSGKIMRRLLEDLSKGREPGNTNTLRNPDVVGDLARKMDDDERA